MANTELGELLSLFAGDDDNDNDDDGDDNEGGREVSTAATTAVVKSSPTEETDGNVDDAIKELEKIEARRSQLLKKIEKLRSTPETNWKDDKQRSSEGEKKKAIRRLVPIDFGCSTKRDESTDRQKGNAGSSSLLHTGDTSSSEDEYERNHDQSLGLSDYGYNIKRQLSLTSKNKPQRNADSTFESKAYMPLKKADEDRKALQEKAKQTVKALESTSKDTFTIFDSFFGIRVRNPLLSSASFQSYCDGLQKIRLSNLKPVTPPAGNWIALAVVVDKTNCRKSANGNEFMIWKAADLLNPQDQTVKILVFGDCVKKFWKLQLGYVLALVAPPYADGDDRQVTLKLTKCAQVLEIGVCPDFGHCMAIKKDGGKCQNVVNLSQCECCPYHIQRAARKVTASRGSFGSILANHKKIEKKAQRSSSFAEGVFTCPRRAAKVPTNTLTITERWKNIKQQTITNLVRPKTSNVREKTTLCALIEKEAFFYGAKNMCHQQGRKENESPVGNVKPLSEESLKEFLLRQPEKKKRVVHSPQLTRDTPVLGRDSNSESVLLTSPQRTFNRLNTLENAKQKAIEIVRKKGGLEKADPNSINGRPRKKRTFEPLVEGSKMKKTKLDENELDEADGGQKILAKISKKSKFTDEEIAFLLKKKSRHEDELLKEDTARQRAYFDTMEKQEKFESFLTTLMEIKNCDVVTCTQCNYTSHKQSDLCKQMGHAVKRHKADKRFFRCKQCHRRAVSYERIPTAPCLHCGDSSYERVAMKDERKVKLGESLLVRGEERKFVNC